MRRLLLTAPVAAALALALPAAAHEPEAPPAVSILFQAFEPPQLSVLAGDAVTWTNMAPREHTVTARDGRFDSGFLPPTRAYAQRFPAAGAYAYFCRNHPTMQGTVDVRALLLRAPPGIFNEGTRIELAGRAIPAIGAVTIEEDTGSGYRPISTASVAMGKFHAVVRPQTSAAYRAVAGPHMSPAARVTVGRPLELRARRHGRKRVRLTTKALAAQPGAPVVLQTWLKERFGWWPVARRRLDRTSHARFTFRRASRGRRLRAVLMEPDGVTERGVSNVARIRGTARRRR